MKIQGYKPGTELRWLEENSEGFRTGIVRARYYDPDITEINGETIEINIIDTSPAYKVRDNQSQKVVVIDHTKVTLRHSDDHR